MIGQEWRHPAHWETIPKLCGWPAVNNDSSHCNEEANTVSNGSIWQHEIVFATGHSETWITVPCGKDCNSEPYPAAKS